MQGTDLTGQSSQNLPHPPSPAPAPPPVPIIPPAAQPAEPTAAGSDHLPPHTAGSVAEMLSLQTPVAATPGQVPSAGAVGERTPLAPGTQVGDYTVTEKIGSGGFGIVYAATHTKDGTLVAIKEHIPEGLAFREPGGTYVVHSSPEQEERFRASVDEFMQEVAVLMGISHPGIVPIIAAFAANGTAYYVMRFVHGKAVDVREEASLDLNEQARDARHNRHILLSMLTILEYLRMHRIVHRDIKPGNILIKPDGEVVLLDFGSARQLQAGKVFANVFTPDLAAPEQAHAAGDKEMTEHLGPWTDIYALGVVMYYLVTRLYPPRSELRVLSAADPYRPLAGRADLEALYGLPFLKAIDRALELKIEDRWQSAAAWRVALGEGLLTTREQQSRSGFRLRLLVPVVVIFAVLCGALFWALWERRSAVRAYDNSVRFTEKLLYDFNKEIEDIPASTRLQAILANYLNTHLNSMGRSSAGAEKDERLTHSLGAAWRNLGTLRLKQGLLKDADGSFARAEVYFRELCARDPQRQGHFYDLADVLLGRVEVARARSQVSHRVKLLNEASRLIDRICQESPGNVFYGCARGRALRERALLAQSRGNDALYRKSLSEMLSLYRSLVAAYSDNVDTRLGFGYALIYNAEAGIEGKNFTQAEAWLEEAMQLFTRLSKEYPYRLSFKKGLSSALFAQGKLYALAGENNNTKNGRQRDYDELAFDAFRKHNELVGYLETQDEEKTEYPYMICRALSDMVEILLRNNQPNLAEGYCRTLMYKIRELRKTAKDNTDFAIQEAAAWRALATVHMRIPERAHDAPAEFARYRSLAEQLLNHTPNNAKLQSLYATALLESAEFESSGGNKNAGDRLYEQAKDILNRLIRTAPGKKEYPELLQKAQDAQKTLQSSSP